MAKDSYATIHICVTDSVYLFFLVSVILLKKKKNMCYKFKCSIILLFLTTIHKINSIASFLSFNNNCKKKKCFRVKTIQAKSNKLSKNGFIVRLQDL